jgi:hypothetical protein
VGKGSSFLAVSALGNHGQPETRGRIKICVPELGCREVMEHQSPKKLVHHTTSYCALQDPPTWSQCGRSPLCSPTFFLSFRAEGWAPPVCSSPWLRHPSHCFAFFLLLGTPACSSSHPHGHAHLSLCCALDSSLCLFFYGSS